MIDNEIISSAIIGAILEGKDKEPRGVPKADNNVRFNEAGRESSSLTSAERSKLTQIIDIVNKKANTAQNVITAFKTILGDVKKLIPTARSGDLQPNISAKITRPSIGETSPKIATAIQQSSGELTSAQERRYTQIFTVMGKVLGIGKFQEGPEADQLTLNQKPDKEKISSKSTTAAPTLKKDRSLIMDLLKAAGIGALFYDLINEKFGPLLTALYATVKTSVNQAWTKILKPFIDSVDGLKSGIEKAKAFVVSKLKSVGAIIGEQIASLTNAVSSVLANMWKSFKGMLDGVFEKLKGLKDNILGSAKSVLSQAGNAIYDASPPALQKAYNVVGKGLAIAGTKTMQVAKIVKDVGGNATQFLISKAKTALQQLVKDSGGVVGVLGKMGKALKPFAKLPVVGTFIEMLFGKGDIDKLKQQRVLNQITSDKELYDKAGKRVLEGLGGVFGGAGGAILGTALGGPIGTLLGAIAGDLGGRAVANLASNIIPPNAIQTAGKAVVSGVEMQDFIIKGGKVYRFNSKDELLGMKEGGAINNLLSTLSTSNQKQYTFATKQIQVLEEIREGIKRLIDIGANNHTTTSKNSLGVASGGDKRPSFKQYAIRDQFKSQYTDSTMATNLL